MIEKTIMTKSGKRKRSIQAYRCRKGHFFTTGTLNGYADSFVEYVVFVYLRCLSLNTTVDIVRATYEDEVLTKATVLSFLEQVADAVPTSDDIDNLLHPKRSGYLAFDGVWFTFRGMQIVLLVCFDPETFDVVGALWSLSEDEKAYTTLLQRVLKKLGKQAIMGVYGDGDKGLVSALKTHLPLVPFQLCIVHKEMRMGQLVPVKSVNISKRLSEQMKQEILGFQTAFRAVLYAESKPASLAALQLLRHYIEAHPQPRFKQAFRSLKTNFVYTLTHFDHLGMMRDNNLIECFNGILKPRLTLMKGFKKYENLDRYLTLFLLEFRFRPLKESRFAERRDLSPLQIAGVQLPTFYNFLSFLRTSLKLTFTPSEDVI